MVLNVHRTMRLIRDGEKGGGGGREIVYLSLRCHHQNDSCIKMGSGDSHFNVSVGSDGQSHRTVFTNENRPPSPRAPTPTPHPVLPVADFLLAPVSDPRCQAVLEPGPTSPRRWLSSHSLGKLNAPLVCLFNGSLGERQRA